MIDLCDDGYSCSWIDEDGQVYWQMGPMKNLPKKVLNKLLEKYPTPIEKFIKSTED